MEPLTFKIIKDYGSLSGSNIYFRIVDWNGFKKYDVRHWDENGKQPFKGITFDDDELATLVQVLEEALNSEKSETPISTVTMGKISATILNDFGTISQKGDRAKKVTYTNWGRTPKYDIRPWAENYTACGKGITLNDDECQAFLDFLKKELSLQ